MPAPASPDGDAERRRLLRRARRRATALLVAVSAVFAATVAAPEAVAGTTWLGFVQAAAEAAMVGGLADWFAVVALFRHPLGVPIPHTAVIPRSKEGLGANLAGFVADNFLDPDDLATRIDDADLAGRAGRWLADPANATATADRVLDLAASAVADVDPERVADGVVGAGLRGLDAVPVADLAGRGLQAAIADGHHHDLFTAALGAMRDAIVDNEQVLRRRLYEESPRWVPPALDDVVFDRARVGLLRFLDEVAADVDHPVRRIVTARLADLATRLREDEALAASIRGRLADLADHPEVRDWAAATWADLADQFLAAGAPDGPLRRAVADRLADLADRLQHDDQLRAGVDGWVAQAAPAIARESRQEIGALVAATVDRWDADETSDRLELWLGPDLQFVRINGTLVGGLVGLVLHAITLL